MVVKRKGEDWDDRPEINLLRQQNMLLVKQNHQLLIQLQQVQHAANLSNMLTESATLDITAVQEALLHLISQELGYERVIIAWYDAHDQMLVSWRCSCHAPGVAGCVTASERVPVT